MINETRQVLEKLKKDINQLLERSKTYLESESGYQVKIELFSKIRAYENVLQLIAEAEKEDSK